MRDSSNNNKDLDKLFQSRLRNDSPADNNWNVPPVNVFENAVASLGKEPEKKKRYWLPFVLISLIIAGIVFVLVRNSIMIDRLDDEIEVLSKQQSQNKIATKRENKVVEANILQSQTYGQSNKIESSQKESIQTKNTRGEAVVQTTELEISDNLKLGEIEDKKDLKTNQKVGSNLGIAHSNASSNRGEKLNTKNEIVQAPLNEINDKSKNDETILNSTLLYKERPELNNFNKTYADNISVVNTESVIGNSHKQDVNLLDINPPINVSDGSKNGLIKSPTLNVLLPLQTNAIDLMNEDEKILPLNFMEKNLNYIPKIKDNLFNAYLFAGSNFSSFEMSEAEMDNATLTEYDKKYLGYQIGVGLDHKLAPRWSLSYSLRYKSILNKSTYKVQMPYLESDEYWNNNGHRIYSCEMKVITPTGVHTDFMKMEVEENSMEVGDTIDGSTKIEQVFNVGSVSSSVNYTPFKLGKFDLVLSGGLVANQIFSGKQKMNMQIHLKDSLMMQDSYSTSLTFDGNRFYFSGLVGLGIKYNLSQRLSISLDNNFERSFTSIGVKSSDGGSNLKINSTSSNLRVEFRF